MNIFNFALQSMSSMDEWMWSFQNQVFALSELPCSFAFSVTVWDFRHDKLAFRRLTWQLISQSCYLIVNDSDMQLQPSSARQHLNRILLQRGIQRVSSVDFSQSIHGMRSYAHQAVSYPFNNLWFNIRASHSEFCLASELGRKSGQEQTAIPPQFNRCSCFPIIRKS